MKGESIMKRFYLYNAFLLLLLALILFFFKYSGFFMAIIMRQDIIYFSIILPVYVFLIFIGLFYQFFKLDRKNKQLFWIQIGAIMNTLFIGAMLVVSSKMYLTSSIGLEILLMSLATPLIFVPLVYSWVKTFWKNKSI